MVTTTTTLTIHPDAPAVGSPRHIAPWRTRLGSRLHPEAVTAAWYANGCDPAFDPRPHVSRVDVLRWRVARRLRGAS